MQGASWSIILYAYLQYPYQFRNDRHPVQTKVCYYRHACELRHWPASIPTTRYRRIARPSRSHMYPTATKACAICGHRVFADCCTSHSESKREAGPTAWHRGPRFRRLSTVAARDSICHVVMCQLPRGSGYLEDTSRIPWYQAAFPRLGLASCDLGDINQTLMQATSSGMYRPAAGLMLAVSTI